MVGAEAEAGGDGVVVEGDGAGDVLVLGAGVEGESELRVGVAGAPPLAGPRWRRRVGGRH